MGFARRELTWMESFKMSSFCRDLNYRVRLSFNVVALPFKASVVSSSFPSSWLLGQSLFLALQFQTLLKSQVFFYCWRFSGLDLKFWAHHTDDFPTANLGWVLCWWSHFWPERNPWLVRRSFNGRIREDPTCLLVYLRLECHNDGRRIDVFCRNDSHNGRNEVM